MTQGPRAYGSERDDLEPGPQPGRDYRELIGGPLARQLIEVTGWTEEEITTGAFLIGGRASYGPTFSRPGGPWVWEGRHTLIS
ncbi:hypothetical protein AB0G71_20195 [Streptomyces sp. NPDC020403]|uniref:hypothetical protein n=1 Tax=unclassified Streptomyces TaxID=2593676 RepID=UPI0033FD6E01